MPNDVLQGFQNELHTRLQGDIAKDVEYRKLKSEPLIKIISSGDADDPQVIRAQQELEKMYPQSKDLFGKITSLVGKLRGKGTMKPPPTVAEPMQQEASALLQRTQQGAEQQRQAPGGDIAAGVDPNVAGTYTGMLAPPPTQAAPPQPMPQQGATPQPQPLPQPAQPAPSTRQPQVEVSHGQAASAQQSIGPAATSGGVWIDQYGRHRYPMDEKADIPMPGERVPYPQGNNPNAQPNPYGQAQGSPQGGGGFGTLPPPPTTPTSAKTWPPSWAQDVSAVAKTQRERLSKEEIDKEQRQATTQRETTRLSQNQQHANAMELAEQQKKLEAQYGEHWTVNSQYLYNQSNGKWELLPPGQKTDTSLSIPELANIAAGPPGPEADRAKKALDLLKELDAAKSKDNDPYYDVVLDNQVVKVPRSMMGLPRTELAKMARDGRLQAAPRPIYSPEGMPSVGGVAGISTVAPPSIPEGTQANLAGWKQTVDEIENQIIPALGKQLQALGPAAGRIRNLEIGKLGGYGATKEEMQLSVMLKETLMGRAFAEGGKQLTPTELGVFQGLLPEMTDTYDQAIVKADRAAKYLRERYQARLDSMPVNQRRQLSSLPPAKEGGGQNGATGGDTVRVVSPKGQTGTIPRANLPTAIKNGYKEVK